MEPINSYTPLNPDPSMRWQVDQVTQRLYL